MEEDQSFYSIDDGPSARAAMRGQMQLLRTSEAQVVAFATHAEKLSKALTSIGLDSGPAGALLSEEELSKLSVGETFSQLGDFSENLQHQLSSNVIEPLRNYHSSIGAAFKAAKAFDEESEALDSLHLKYLGLSKDSPIETLSLIHI